MPIFGKEVKTIPNEKPETVGEVYRIPIGQLHPHPENPYGIRDDPDMLVPFVDNFPKDTELYRLMTTRPSDKKEDAEE